MSKGTQIVPVDETQEYSDASNEGRYKLLRFQIVQLFEKYTKNKAAALELMERWERGVMGALHLVAPNATAMREGFSVAATQFLQEPPKDG